MSRQNSITFTTVLIITMIVLLPPSVVAQDDDLISAPITISLGTVRTELEQIAVQYAINYAKTFSEKDLNTALEEGSLFFTPEINLEGGEKDAFNSVNAKITGSLLLFTKTTVSGVETPNSKFFHSIPFSAGIETSNRFDNYNFLVEAGYVPWFQGWMPQFWKTLFLGAFIQGGYKASVNDPPIDSDASRGGNKDDSSETLDSGLWRLKGRGTFSPTIIIDQKTGAGLGVEGAGDIWYDILNAEIYHSVTATFRVIIGQNRSIDFFYQNGSGAPNFNEGDQFGVKLKIVL